ncbi:MAG: S9 family peptidase [Planctomycetes bacterium]|nr:S9 family peptidase [Planctomycetota bacterium]
MAKKRPMKLDDLFAMKAVGKVALAPDGRRVVFELKRFDLKENKNFVQLMIADVESGKVGELSKADKHSDTRPQWSRDGARLAFLSTREKATCLFVLPMTGGEPRRVSDRDGNVTDFCWAPNGRRLAYTYQPMNERDKLARDDKQYEIRKRPEYKHVTRLTHKLDGVGFWNGNHTHVFVVGATGGKPKQLTTGNYDDSEPRFSPDGRLVSFVSNRTEDPDRLYDQSAIYVVSASGGRIKRITRGTGYAAHHSWSPDGQTLAYHGAPHKPGLWWKYDEHIWLVDAKGGKSRELTRDIDNTCGNVTLGDVAGTPFDSPPPIWSLDGARLYFLVSEQGATRLYSRSIHRKDTRCEVGGNVVISDVQRTARDGRIALTIGTATNPGDVFVADPNDGCALKRLSEVNGNLFKRVAAVEPEEFWLKSGNSKLHCWVLKPPGFKANRKYPAILEVHGGPQAQYGYSFFHEMQWMAAKGYVVAYCNPRGSSGYGCDFRKCIIGQWGSVDHQDVKKLGDWLFARPFVDRKRVGITGGSYGGFMTNWVIGRETRYRAAVTQRSCVNFESFFGTSDCGFVIAGELKGLPWKDHEKLRQQSPLTFVKNIKTPLLIVHSEQDLRCPLEQAEQLFVALKYLGRVVEFVAFEGESHGLSRGGRPQNRGERLRRIVGWFDKQMK